MEKGIIDFKFMKDHIILCNMDLQVKVDTTKEITLSEAFGYGSNQNMCLCDKKCNAKKCICCMSKKPCNFLCHGFNSGFLDCCKN